MRDLVPLENGVYHILAVNQVSSVALIRQGIKSVRDLVLLKNFASQSEIVRLTSDVVVLMVSRNAAGIVLRAKNGVIRMRIVLMVNVANLDVAYHLAAHIKQVKIEVGILQLDY